jgi:hypothetical protein
MTKPSTAIDFELDTHPNKQTRTWPFQRWRWNGMSNLDSFNFSFAWAASLYALWYGSE